MGKVLIIDDEKQILGLLSRIIGLEGYEVLQAATCKAGLRQMEQHSPEVVLCDVFLPDGNGVDLVSDLKKLRPLSEIILLTRMVIFRMAYRQSRMEPSIILRKGMIIIRSFLW